MDELQHRVDRFLLQMLNVAGPYDAVVKHLLGISRGAAEPFLSVEVVSVVDVVLDESSADSVE
ncbi:MAG: hypothetical protein ACRCYQ_06835 [Nocardioides sp.]